MPPTSQRRSGSSTIFDSFKISKPVQRTNVKANVGKAAVTSLPATLQRDQKSSGEQDEEATKVVDVHVEAEAAETPKVVRPALEEGDEAYLNASRAILGARKTPIVHERPNTIEIILRDFDLTGKYGPCVGMTRLARYNRALKMKMNPPEVVGKILMTQEAEDRSAYKHDLFYGRL